MELRLNEVYFMAYNQSMYMKNDTVISHTVFIPVNLCRECLKK